MACLYVFILAAYTVGNKNYKDPKGGHRWNFHCHNHTAVGSLVLLGEVSMLFRLSPPRRKGLWALACAFGLISPTYAAGLNDTGITDCWNDTAVVTTGVEADNGTHKSRAQ